jgi:hypothetical protein
VYVGTKVVRAARVIGFDKTEADVPSQHVWLSVEIATDDGPAVLHVSVPSEVFLRGTPVRGDWIVVYSDGYTSWTTAAAFGAYRPRLSGVPFREWPERLRHLVVALRGCGQFVSVDCMAEYASDQAWWQAAWQREHGPIDVSELQQVRFGGSEAPNELADFLEWRFADLLAPKTDQRTSGDGVLTIDMLAEECAGPVALGAVVQLVAANRAATKVGVANDTVVHEVSFKTVLPPGQQVQAGATIGEVKLTVAWRPDDPEIAWMGTTLGQHYLATVRPVDGAKLAALLASKSPGAEQPVPSAAE